MALTVSDLQDLIRLLDEHPDWKAELRRRLIDDEWAELRNDIRALVAATQAHDKRLDDIDERLRQLVETTQAHAHRLDDVDERLRQLVETATAHSQRLESVDGTLLRIGTAIDGMNLRLDRHDDRLGKLDGRSLELRFRNMAYSYFGSHLRRVKVLTLDEVPGLLDALDAERISQSQWDSLVRLDAIISGVPHGARDRQLLVTLEVSATIDDHDVERAVAGADVLKHLGLDVLAAVGGDAIRDEARKLAATEEVAVLAGQLFTWPLPA